MADIKNKLVTVESLDYVYDSLIQKIEDRLAEALYIPIEINSFSSSITSAEIGSNITSVTLDWSLNKPASSVKIDGNVIQTAGTTGSITLTNLNIKNDKTWTLTAEDEKGTATIKTTSVTFLNRAYWGTAIEFTTEAMSSALASSKEQTFTVTANSGEYIWYAIPSRMGACSFNVGGFGGGFTLVNTINITNGSGYSESYYIYRSDNASLGSTTITVS